MRVKFRLLGDVSTGDVFAIINNNKEIKLKAEGEIPEVFIHLEDLNDDVVFVVRYLGIEVDRYDIREEQGIGSFRDYDDNIKIVGDPSYSIPLSSYFHDKQLELIEEIRKKLKEEENKYNMFDGFLRYLEDNK